MAVLRLLLDDPSLDADHVDWTLMREIAERSGVIVRVADTLLRRGEELPPRLSQSAAVASARTQHVLEIVDQLGAACRRLGIRHAFLKTAERYPDTGRDIDLLIGEPVGRVDAAIFRSFPAAPRKCSWRNRLAGSRTFAAAHGIVIDIRHGRVGMLGEHARYARLLLERACLAALGNTTCLAPSPEDNLLLIATQQVYTRPRLRLADVFWTIRTLQTRALNWDYVFATALSMGMVAAVGTYLQYIEGIHARIFDRTLIDPAVLLRFEGSRAEQTTRFPPADPRAAARLYLQQFGATLESGRWHSAARLSLLPVVAVAALAARGGSRRTR